MPEPRDSPNYGGPESPMHEQYRRFANILLFEFFTLLFTFFSLLYIRLISSLFQLCTFVIMQQVTPCRRMIRVLDEKSQKGQLIVKLGHCWTKFNFCKLL